MSAGKTNAGNFFEDFTLGQVIEHATPRTITEGDRALGVGQPGSPWPPQWPWGPSHSPANRAPTGARGGCGRAPPRGAPSSL